MHGVRAHCMVEHRAAGNGTGAGIRLGIKASFAADHATALGRRTRCEWVIARRYLTDTSMAQLHASRQTEIPFTSSSSHLARAPQPAERQPTAPRQGTPTP
jgi:hypothetical protein